MHAAPALSFFYWYRETPESRECAISFLSLCCVKGSLESSNHSCTPIQYLSSLFPPFPYSTMLALWSLLALASAASATPSSRSFHDNGLQAQALNAQFQTLSILDDCSCMCIVTVPLLTKLMSMSAPSTACIQNGFAQCVGTSWQVTQCPSTLICVAIPGAAADNDVVSTRTPRLLHAGANSAMNHRRLRAQLRRMR